MDVKQQHNNNNNNPINQSINFANSTGLDGIANFIIIIIRAYQQQGNASPEKYTGMKGLIQSTIFLAHQSQRLQESFSIDRDPTALSASSASSVSSIFSNNFSSDTTGPVSIKFHIQHLAMVDWKFVQMVQVSWTRWPQCPYMIKTLKNLLL